MDLSKAFDILAHDLIIAKLHAYGVDYTRSYLSNQRQRIKVGLIFSSWLQTIIAFHQGSILGSLPFKVF